MNYTKHAITRSQQRGIPRRVVELICAFGTDTQKPGGVLERYIPGRMRNELIQKKKWEIQALERTKDIAVLVDEDDEHDVISMYHIH